MPLRFSGAQILWGFAAFALLLPSFSHAYVLKRDASGSVIHWNRPVEFIADEKLSQILGEPGAIAAVTDALNSWSAAAPTLPMSIRTGQVEGVGYDQTPGATNKSEIYALAQWLFDENAIAVTLVTTDTSTHEILDADIALNIKSHTFRVLPVPNSDNHFDDIQNVVTHELGHALGLAHNPDDSKVVMYPSARLGETSKRSLALDDEDGAAALYPPGGPRIAPAHGCNAAPEDCDLARFAMLLAGGLLLQSRKRASTTQRLRAPLPCVAACAFLMMPARVGAQDNERADAPVRDSAIVATTEVLSTRLNPESQNARVLLTEVEVSVRSCIKGDCPQTLVVLVVGGRVGKIEQFIDGEPVPKPGDILGITLSAAPPSQRAAALSQARVYRLALERDFSAFARGLRAAGVNAVFPAPGSSAPYR